MTKYIMVAWPEIQYYMDHERWNDCIACQNVRNHQCPDDAWMVPEEVYEEVSYKRQFPKTYENTKVGKVVCYYDKAVVNDSEVFEYDKELKKGDKVLIYDQDNKDWIITECTAPFNGNLPCLFKDNHLLVGINCEIIGYHD